MLACSPQPGRLSSQPQTTPAYAHSLQFALFIFAISSFSASCNKEQLPAQSVAKGRKRQVHHQKTTSPITISSAGSYPTNKQCAQLASSDHLKPTRLQLSNWPRTLKFLLFLHSKLLVSTVCCFRSPALPARSLASANHPLHPFSLLTFLEFPFDTSRRPLVLHTHAYITFVPPTEHVVMEPLPALTAQFVVPPCCRSPLLASA
ncbi:hypothetical protein BT63DRAFT_101569 [Microthyrium microscopicum]|uniref:Uncharacterized protein n=1 Tax=Microthyrium microscopicum TaxID=703497 RepID=A0A6A6TXR4_9PEZI|nr:hypothetical protein BT63DRAFT_101569 [Microthyrium microscopicum]